MAAFDHAWRLQQAAVASVFVRGETGSGKELVARTLNDPGKPFEAVNCSAIPEHLFESEFFGYERGAFTGANRTHQGCLERSDGGTLFLDEIADLSLAHQVKLLRCLEQRTVRRVGGSRNIDFTSRVVVACAPHLFDLVRAGRFREDLYWRVAVHVVELPALRDRSDRLELAQFWLSRLAKELRRPPQDLTLGAWRQLETCPWSGNIRQLRAVLARAVVATAAKDPITRSAIAGALKPERAWPLPEP